ncbi:hypothetical protein H0H93_003103 [Arthromyces matolae]|nr:hypothetical protein H0H93_003103 [Arthromyces matolae]
MPDDPSQLFFQSNSVRRSIIKAYWIIIILALPLWWHTTSIQRLSLPSSRLLSQTQDGLRIPVRIRLPAGLDRQGLQKHIDSIAKGAPSHWERLSLEFSENIEQNSGGSGSRSAQFWSKSRDDDGSYTVYDSESISLSARHLSFPTASLSALADTLSQLIAPQVANHRVAPYSPRYRLSFTLLNEDAAAGGSFLEWDVLNAISHHIQPKLSQLKELHNFTIESQVQLHAPLAFSPRLAKSGFGIDPEDLTWGSIVIFNPDETSQSTKLASSSLDSVFASFSDHLLALLGIPDLPPSIPKGSNKVTKWQLDALLRYRTLSNAEQSQDTLRSIVSLVDRIENMPVGQDVRGDVEDALSALEELLKTSNQSLRRTFALSARAFTLSSRAFFNPGMLAMLYFPAEHKYAVYTPLFASAVIPLFVAALREIAAWRRQRKEAASQRQPTDSTGQK